MQRNSFPYVRTVIVVIAIGLLIAWQRSSRSQTPAATAQFGVRPGIGWIRLNSNADVIVNAAKVPGGWFVCVLNRGLNPDDALNVGGAFFYPDPMHVWKGTTLP